MKHKHLNREAKGGFQAEGGTADRRRIKTEGVADAFKPEAPSIQRRLRSIVCPFCDHEIKARENVVKCWNCGECFELEPDEEEFILGSASGF